MIASRGDLVSGDILSLETTLTLYPPTGVDGRFAAVLESIRLTD